ncbi:hypothetical protein RFI_20830 [Reticulomyxa filosa]|uniref:Uncharacterized protein n=1 Tax=Reticulomyxa filosa TaxID=46433 RepID=X6MTS3_RETFI|nr:hypothetical protein RFI_20830 [Reticulomyxa filosa]|eukprot:ETO16510.1 hypothetical protein RFI_20830 [Reticulomyxa filosa]
MTLESFTNEGKEFKKKKKGLKIEIHTNQGISKKKKKVFINNEISSIPICSRFEANRSEWCDKLRKAIAGTLPKRRTTRKLLRSQSANSSPTDKRKSVESMSVNESHENGKKKRSSVDNEHSLLLNENEMKSETKEDNDADNKVNNNSNSNGKHNENEKENGNGNENENRNGNSKTNGKTTEKRQNEMMKTCMAFALSQIVSYLSTVDASALFITAKWFRRDCIATLNHASFFQYYSFKALPLKTLRRYSATRQTRFPWIFAHNYKQIWVFGNCPEFKYSTLTLAELQVDKVCRLELDDIMLWNPDDQDIEEVLLFAKSRADQIQDLHVRSYTENPKWLKLLCRFPQVKVLTLSMKLHSFLFDSLIRPENIVHLSLLRVDTRGGKARNCATADQVFRFVPLDHSVVDLQRIVREDDARSHDLGYELNYALDLIVDHKNWPGGIFTFFYTHVYTYICILFILLRWSYSEICCANFFFLSPPSPPSPSSVLNSSLRNGHEALKQHRLRVWILHKRQWDQQVMNINYTKKPPPLKLFEVNNCYSELARLDNLTDMSALWETKNEKKLP